MTQLEIKLMGAKEKAQEEFAEVMSKQVAKYAAAVKNEKLTIDMIEAFMGEAMAEGERIIKEITEDAIKISEPELLKKKKYALTAMKK